MLRRQSPSPYVRRVAWIRQIQRLLGERDVEQAADVLKVLRKDMGLEGSSLSDILYKNAAFLNLVDPISHELLLNLARDMQCPKKVKPLCDTIKDSSTISVTHFCPIITVTVLYFVSELIYSGNIPQPFIVNNCGHENSHWRQCGKP
ncbi:hypothetical protein Z043_123190, partial [Scleropages formosus]